jgi:hypothetical protein
VPSIHGALFGALLARPLLERFGNHGALVELFDGEPRENAARLGVDDRLFLDEAVGLFEEKPLVLRRSTVGLAVYIEPFAARLGRGAC